MSRLYLSLLLWSALIGQAGSVSHPGRLLVVNLRLHSLMLVDPLTRHVVATIPVGVSGHEIALSGDQKTAYIPIYSDTVLGESGSNGQTIDIVDLHTRKVTASIDLGRPLRPHSAVFGPDGLLYVTAELSNVVEVIDIRTRRIVGEIPTGKPQSHMLALTPDGSRGYTANVDSGTVSVLDLRSRTLLKIIPVAKRIQRIAISADGRWVYTCDWDAPRVAAIDTKTNTVSHWIPVNGMPFATRPTPDGRWLLVAESDKEKGRVDVVDLRTMKTAHTYAVMGQPFGIFIHGDIAYMTCIVTGRIEMLNLHTWTMQTPMDFSPGVDGMAWSDQIM